MDAQKGDKPRILIVEDEFLVAEDLRRKLHLLGYEVVEIVARGKKAIQITGELLPDLVMMDIKLQGNMSGIDAAAKIRAVYDIPVVYLTAHADEGTLRDAKSTEPFGYILKPFRDWELRTNIENALFKHEQDRKVRESEERFRSTFEQVAVGMMHGALDGRFLLVNQRFCDIVGYSQEELMSLTWQEITHPDDVANIQRLLQMLLAGEIESCTIEKRYLHKDSSIAWVNLTVTPHRKPNGKPWYFICVIEDIAQRKQALEALRIQHKLAMAFNKARSLQEVLDQLLEASMQIDGIDCGGVYLVDAYSGGLELAAHIGLGKTFVESVSHFDKDAPQTRLVKAGVPIYSYYDRLLPDTKDAVRENEDLRAIAIIPISQESRIIAALNLSSHTHTELSPSTCMVIESLAVHVGDVITRMRAEESLRESEHRYRTIVTNAPIVIFTTERNGIFTLSEGKGLATLGLEPGQVVGRSALEVYADYPDIINSLERALAGEAHRAMITLDDLVFDTLYTPLMNEEGQVSGLIGVSTNITERVQAEAERERLLQRVRHQAHQVREIMNTVPEGVMLLDNEHKVQVANRVAQGDLQFLAGAQVGDKLSHLGDHPLVELLDKPPKGLWHEVKHEERTFEVIARPMSNGTEAEHWVIMLRDVTRERMIKSGIQQQEQLAAVGQLAGGIAHDFNNILAVIRLYTEISLGTPNLDPRVHEHLETVVQQAKTATDLIQQVLDFSRRSVLERRPMDLLPFLQQQIRLLERTLPENIYLQLDYAPREFRVNADPTRLQQAMMNLVINSRDAMPDGGSLRISLAQVYSSGNINCVSCGHVLEGDFVCITFSDTGTGIALEDLPHIFEPFFSTKPTEAGSGLGLAQVFGIIKQHEGHINVSTIQGAGSTFAIYLPALPAGQAEASERDSGILIRGNGETILIVEDEPATRQALMDGLTLLKYNVATANDGFQALDFLETRGDEVSLVLSDVVMPEMGGIDLFRAMQEQDITVPLILMTGYPLQEELEKLQAARDLTWTLKPLGLKKLSQIVASKLRKV